MDNSVNVLVERVCGEFVRSMKLIEGTSDEIYTACSEKSGSIGAHFRHNIDFVNNFLQGIESGKIDYNIRERDVRIETNRHYAIERTAEAIEKLSSLSDESLGAGVLVRSEVDERIFHQSSVLRELEFLHSHTIHHYAIVAEKLRDAAIEIDFEFGVAPSTLKFWSESRRDLLPA